MYLYKYFWYFFIDVDIVLFIVLSYLNNIIRSLVVEKMVLDCLCLIKDYFFYRKFKVISFVDLKLLSKYYIYRGFDVLFFSDDEDDCNIYY